jgi:hypothetical protein
MGNHNSGRRPGYQHSDQTRSRIQATQIAMRLQDCLLGKITLTPEQIKCGQILLKKCLPDLSAVDTNVSGSQGVYLISDHELNMDEWAEKYGDPEPVSKATN